GSRAFLGGFARAQESRVIDEVVAAATELARHRMGALIAFEQDANLDEFVVAQGIQVESMVTRELLVSLFVPESVNKLPERAADAGRTAELRRSSEPPDRDADAEPGRAEHARGTRAAVHPSASFSFVGAAAGAARPSADRTDAERRRCRRGPCRRCGRASRIP